MFYVAYSYTVSLIHALNIAVINNYKPAQTFYVGVVFRESFMILNVNAKGLLRGVASID